MLGIVVTRKRKGLPAVALSVLALVSGLFLISSDSGSTGLRAANGT
jgi:hypothetical protein